MPANLLSLPFRVCGHIPLDKALSEIISRDFYQPATAFDDLHRAQQLHAYISGARDTDTDLEKYEKSLAEFFYVVKDISAKFPDNVVTFEWYDTFQSRPPVFHISEWRSEQHYLVCQMGILYSQKAQKENIHSEEGLKKACALFQHAAGCFQYLLDQKTTAIGLDQNTLNCLRVIMVSEAQELIWRKAVRNTTMKDSVIARLSAQVAEYYGDAAKYATVSDSIRQEWINHLNVKQYHFRAAAYYRMSINALDTFEYGAQVAYLKSALDQCKTALKHKRYVSQFVLEDLAGLTKTVEESLKTAEKDNDLVYLKPVPEFQELPSIVGVSMVAPKMPSFLLERDPEFKPAFSKLMPFSVIQVSQAFRERQDTYIATVFHEPLRALNRMLRQFLTERQLPASLDTLQIPESIPDSIIQHSQEIISIGGIRIIESSMDEISVLASNSKVLVSECEERLHLEKKEDDIMREREGSARWTRTPSNVSGAKFWETIEKMHEYISQGQQSDALLGEIYASIRETLEAYCGGQQALLRCIPKNGHINLDPAGEKVAFELRELLAEVSKLETKRERFETSIDLKSRNHSILSVVIDAFKRNPEKFQNPDGMVDQMKFEPVYEKHIAFFHSDMAYLAQSKEQQLVLEKKIHETSQKFDLVKESSLSKAQEARLGVLQKLENDYVRYLELVQNLNQASKFYTSFLEKGNAVLKELDEYLLKRREEARELAMSIRAQQNFEGIEHAMERNPGRLAAPRGQKTGLWDPSKGIHFS